MKKNIFPALLSLTALSLLLGLGCTKPTPPAVPEQKQEEKINLIPETTPETSKPEEESIAAPSASVIPASQKEEAEARVSIHQIQSEEAEKTTPEPSAPAPTPAPTPAPEPVVEEEPEEETAPAPAFVSIESFAFVGATITVPKGATVTWTNKDSAPHTVTGSGFDSGNMNQGASYSHTFAASGTYSYICAYHPSMKGTVIVQ